MLAIVPVKGVENAKSRLAPFLSDRERAALVIAMLDDVLAACEAASAVTETLVVTPDARVNRGDGRLIDAGTGHGEAVAFALRDERARAGALVVMGDCPLVTAESLDRLLAAARPVALAPASDGGMNALALASPDAVDPAFGADDAARVTLERAQAAGLEPAVVDDPALAFDVDNPPDVWKLRESGQETRARDVLEQILPPTGGLL